MPFCYQHPDYWRIILEESKRTGNMIASRKLFDDSEAAHPITEEEFIKVENIRGKLFLVGAEDDALWDTAKYIRRMEKRLAEKPHSCEVEAVVYEHGTHFVFPRRYAQDHASRRLGTVCQAGVQRCEEISQGV